MDSDLEPKLISLISQLSQNLNSDLASEVLSVVIQIISLVSLMDLDSLPKPESKLMSLVIQATSVFNAMDLDSQPKPLSDLVHFISQNISLGNHSDTDLESESESDAEFMLLVDEVWSLEPMPELISLIHQILSPLINPESESEAEADFLSELESEWAWRWLWLVESDIIYPITQLMYINIKTPGHWQKHFMTLCFKVINKVMSPEWDLQPKPESKLRSLVNQTITVFNSMDSGIQPKPLLELISLSPRNVYAVEYWRREEGNSHERLQTEKFKSLLDQTLSLEPEPELVSLIHQIFSLVISVDPEWKNRICVCPQVQVRLQGKQIIFEEIMLTEYNKWDCLPGNWCRIYSKEEQLTHFFCNGCKGRNHEECDKAPLEIKHPLHPKHSLQLVVLHGDSTRECYCCDQGLNGIFYYCQACDFAISIACVEKPPVFSIVHPKWHEHQLSLFSRTTSLTCDLCAMVDSTDALYICPPCGFVTHQSCTGLPRVIRISRHPHRISFTHSFGRGDWSCGICRRKVENDYGGYSCMKEGCSYAAHSKCATQSNVWDGVDLDGEPEEIEEEILEPFVKISDGIIQHFSHQRHHLRLDENTNREYDEYKMCQACTTPIYYGNFYSCMQCAFILHDTCANLPRKIYHPLHSHPLTLVTDGSNVIEAKISCSACPWLCTGFFYECNCKRCKEEKSNFKVHVQCATISEPLVHQSHMHPLFLTSKPGERRTCGVCNGSRRTSSFAGSSSTTETFNCIECDFSLCYACATLPEKVMYKHDKHMLTLSYGEETSTMAYWCEACEEKLNPKERFYKCDEYCSVTLHIECLVEKDLYMKPGLSLCFSNLTFDVLPNNHRMSMPFCIGCRERPRRCPYKYFVLWRDNMPSCYSSWRDHLCSCYCSISCFCTYINFRPQDWD